MIQKLSWQMSQLEKHLKDCQTYHADEWTQWYQDFLDGKF